MSVLTIISKGFLSVCANVAKGIHTVNETVYYLFEINYQVVSTVYSFIFFIISAAVCVLKTLSNIVFVVLQYTVDFVHELSGCLFAFCVLIWRVIVLVYKVVCFIITGLETLAVALWSGSYVTLSTLKKSAVDISDYCGSTWNYASQMIQELFCAIVNSFSSIGNSVINGIVELFRSSTNAVLSVFVAIRSSVYSLENSIRHIFSRIVYFYTSFLPSLGKETYLGIFICCLMYLVCIKGLRYLHHHGMTLFTYQRRTHHHSTSVLDSDVEDLSDNDQNESVISESSEYQDGTEANDSDDMSEHSVDDHDDEDSELSLNSQTFSSSDEDEDEIEIEMPSESEHHGLRNRSMTPSRGKLITAEEFEREIEREKDKRKCVVCQDRSKSVLILPCRHMCLCISCANQIIQARYVERRVCPLCRQKIQKVMNVYT